MNINSVNNQKTLTTPVWVLAIRIAQVILSIVILGMAATWSDYALFDGPSLAIAAVCHPLPAIFLVLPLRI